MEPSWTFTARRVLKWAMLAAALVAAAGFWREGALPDPADLRPEVLRMPIQRDTRRPPFTFAYAGESYVVRPRAEYELWGLVVSHNDPEGFGDIYHDESSVDTRDLCVLFGENATRADYQRIDFWSGAWTCRYQYPAGVTFRPEGVSNNHLVTDDPEVRARTRSIQVGDQVHVRGLLVDYRPAPHENAWRKTSLTRRDTEQGACEVVFVTTLEVMQRGTPAWYAAHTWGLRALIVSALGWVVLLVAGIFRR